jgi:hypothetical protein
MPIVAVGVAIAADVALASGAIAATAFTITAAVGATIGAIGAVTHNKALTYVGAGLGLVGGIGSLASAAGVLGDSALTQPLWGGAQAAADTTAAAAPTAEAAAAGSTSGDVVSSLAGSSSLTDQAAAASEAAMGPTGSTATDAAAAASQAATTAPADAAFNGEGINFTKPVTVGATDTGQSAGASTAGTPVGQAAYTPASGLTNVPATEQSTFGTANNAFGTPGQSSMGAVGGQPLIPTNTTDQAGGVSDSLSGILGFVQKNPLLAYGALQAGGQFLSGMTSTLTPAQVNLLNAQAASNQAAANLTAQQTTNLAQPKPIATLAPVTGQPGQPIIAQPTAGMINSAPRINVTGVPA